MAKKNEEISEEMNVENNDMPTEEEMNELIQNPPRTSCAMYRAN